MKTLNSHKNLIKIKNEQILLFHRKLFENTSYITDTVMTRVKCKFEKQIIAFDAWLQNKTTT